MGWKTFLGILLLAGAAVYGVAAVPEDEQVEAAAIWLICFITGGYVVAGERTPRGSFELPLHLVPSFPWRQMVFGVFVVGIGAAFAHGLVNHRPVKETFLLALACATGCFFTARLHWHKAGWKRLGCHAANLNEAADEAMNVGQVEKALRYRLQAINHLEASDLDRHFDASQFQRKHFDWNLTLRALELTQEAMDLGSTQAIQLGWFQMYERLARKLAQEGLELDPPAGPVSDSAPFSLPEVQPSPAAPTPSSDEEAVRRTESESPGSIIPLLVIAAAADDGTRDSQSCEPEVVISESSGGDTFSSSDNGTCGSE